MKRQFLIPVCLFVFSYNGYCQTSSNDNNSLKKQFLFPKKIKLNLNTIINEIGSYTTVDGAAVGYGAIESLQYNRFKNLMSIATDSQLVALTDYFNPNVKAYAFWALVIKHNSEVKTILTKHIHDKQSFQFLSGCIGERQNINEWFLNLAKLVLTSEEIEKYSIILKS